MKPSISFSSYDCITQLDVLLVVVRYETSVEICFLLQQQSRYTTAICITHLSYVTAFRIPCSIIHVSYNTRTITNLQTYGCHLVLRLTDFCIFRSENMERKRNFPMIPFTQHAFPLPFTHLPFIFISLFLFRFYSLCIVFSFGRIYQTLYVPHSLYTLFRFLYFISHPFTLSFLKFFCKNFVQKIRWLACDYLQTNFY